VSAHYPTTHTGPTVRAGKAWLHCMQRAWYRHLVSSVVSLWCGSVLLLHGSIAFTMHNCAAHTHNLLLHAVIALAMHDRAAHTCNLHLYDGTAFTMHDRAARKGSSGKGLVLVPVWQAHTTGELVCATQQAPAAKHTAGQLVCATQQGPAAKHTAGQLVRATQQDPAARHIAGMLVHATWQSPAARHIAGVRAGSDPTAHHLTPFAYKKRL